MKSLSIMASIVAISAMAADQERTFLERAISAGRAHDLAQWQSLYCKPRIPSSADVRAIKYFTSATLLEPAHTAAASAKFQLSVCFETPATKEMCMLVPIVQENGTLCLSPPPPKRLIKGAQ